MPVLPHEYHMTGTSKRSLHFDSSVGDISRMFIFFFYRYITTHTFKQHKALSPSTNILGVPGKNITKKFLTEKLTKNN